VGNPEGKRPLGRHRRRWDAGVSNGSSCLRIGTFAGTCKCGNDRSDSIKCGEFLELLRTG